jgi:hypothetical protein
MARTSGVAGNVVFDFFSVDFLSWDSIFFLFCVSGLNDMKEEGDYGF